jgi:cob(I)alamin adenosyltransferase
MRLYTRTGDRGSTRLFGGQPVLKSHPRVRAYGEVDELNSVLGWARVAVEHEDLQALLERLQAELFEVGADLATPEGTEARGKENHLCPERVQALEEALDRLQTEVPPFRQFILPGGAEAAARLHIARTVCRRVERAVVALAEREPVNPEVLRYLNRLSDLLFLLACVVNHRAGVKETPWGRTFDEG